MSSNRRQAAPRGPGWAHELKHDGYRLQIHVRNGRVRLYTMNGANWTDRYPCIIEEAARIKGIVSCGRWRLKFGMVVRGRGSSLPGKAEGRASLVSIQQVAEPTSPLRAQRPGRSKSTQRALKLLHFCAIRAGTLP